MSEQPTREQFNADLERYTRMHELVLASVQTILALDSIPSRVTMEDSIVPVLRIGRGGVTKDGHSMAVDVTSPAANFDLSGNYQWTVELMDLDEGAAMEEHRYPVTYSLIQIAATVVALRDTPA